MIVPSQAIVANWLQSFKEFPIRQKPASFNLATSGSWPTSTSRCSSISQTTPTEIEQ